jgi:hypothetical protein
VGGYPTTDASVKKTDGNKVRTTEIMVAFRTRRTERIGIFEEALPLLGVFSLGVCYGESIPDTRVDFGHLWLLYNLDFALSTPWVLRVSRR